MTLHRSTCIPAPEFSHRETKEPVPPQGTLERLLLRTEQTGWSVVYPFSDSPPCENALCVNSKLASFGVFCGVFTLQTRPCSRPSPWDTPSAASVPTWDEIPILSFVESSMTRWESCPTSGPELLSAIGSLLSLSSRPPDSTSHCSSATWHSSSAICHSSFAIRPLSSPICLLSSPIRHPPSGTRHPPSDICHPPSDICHPPSGSRHPPSGICHLAFAIRHLAFAIRLFACPIPRSPFRIPPSAFFEGFPAFAAALGAGRTGTAGAARTPGCNPAPRGRPNRGPRPLRWPRSWPATP